MGDSAATRLQKDCIGKESAGMVGGVPELRGSDHLESSEAHVTGVDGDIKL